MRDAPKKKLKKRLLVCMSSIAIILALLVVNVVSDFAVPSSILKLFGAGNQSSEVTLSADRIIYIDEANGNDEAGDGSSSKPFKTLDKISDAGIVVSGFSYIVKLGDGHYTLTTKIFELNYDNSLSIVGNKENTILATDGLYPNGCGGKTTYTVNFYRLVWHANSMPTNAIFLRTPMNFYNVALSINFGSASYSYFIPGGGALDAFYNCVLPRYVSGVLRNDCGQIELTNCYGGFHQSYGNTSWNYQTNYVTTNPQVDSNYNITDDESVWKNVGTGTNPDGTQANLGVYGGKYSWNADLKIKVKDAYRLSETSKYLQIGSTYSLEIIDKLDRNLTINKSDWTWTSDNNGIATVDGNGNIRAVGKGITVIKGVNEEEESTLQIVICVYETSIEEILPKITTDKVIHIDEANGNDETGDGSKTNPYKTLDKIADLGIIAKGYNYIIKLGDGTYTLTTKIFELNCDESISIIGNREKTILATDGLYANGSGGKTTYTVNLYRLVWKALSMPTNAIYLRTPMNFYNVAFNIDFNSASYSYFFPLGTVQEFNNCVLPRKVIGVLRNDAGTIRLTNCYGGFNHVYGNNTWDYETNYITETPLVDSNYNITQDDGVWRNVGTGENFGGTQANLGVYGGYYSWEYDLVIKEAKIYDLSTSMKVMKKGESDNIEIIEKTGQDLSPNASNWVWTSANGSIATVDGNGRVTAVNKGIVLITGVNESEDSTLEQVVSVYENDISEALPQISADKVIHIDEANGSDETGDGSKTNPYKTLDKIADLGIIVKGYRYIVKLGDGNYTLTNKVFELDCDDSVNIIGNKEKTILATSGIYSGGGGGKTTYTVNFYRLVWKALSMPINAICLRTPMNLYNVAFNIEFNTASYAYFMPTSRAKEEFYNCVLPRKVVGVLRNDEGTMQLTNCYGGFNHTYGNNTWDYETNYITETPLVDSNYNITEDRSVWKNVGTGENFGGTQASLGVYGGYYSWEYDLVIKEAKVYEITEKMKALQIDEKYDIEIIEKTGQDLDPNESNWVWTSSDGNIASVDGNGKVTAKNKGVSLITGVNEEEESKLQIVISVYENDITEALPKISSDKVIYVDEANGDDETGDGSKLKPFKTLDQVADSGIIEKGATYTIKLEDGTYTLTTKMLNLNCNRYVNIVGNTKNTILKVTSLYPNALGGSTNYNINFYRLIWNGVSTTTNNIYIKTGFSFYNVAFDLNFTSGAYYFFPYQTTFDLYNCALGKKVTDIFRVDAGNILLTNCYGGFPSGTAWDYQTNFFTDNPTMDANYNILENPSIWKNVGTGENFGGTKANLGVYGGYYSWDLDLYIEVFKEYHPKENFGVVKIGEKYEIEIVDVSGQDSYPNTSNWVWESADTNIATVDRNGIVKGISKGITLVTGVNEKENSTIKISIGVYEKSADEVTATISADRIIYVDEEKGNDVTGDGSKINPFKTLDKVADVGIIEDGYSYIIKLEDGNYTLTTKMFELDCSESISIVGNTERTNLITTGLYPNACGGKTTYTVNFYRLVWCGVSAPSNAIFVRTPMNFYNVAFNMSFNSASYSYFIPGGGALDAFYNCVLPKRVDSILRNDAGVIQLTNCYGGFHQSYGNDSWNYQTNYITNTPEVDSSYNIKDDESVWKNVGTGENFGGTQANLGVYGGYYTWEYKLILKESIKYEINQNLKNLKVGNIVSVELVEKTGQDLEPDVRKWEWKSLDTSVATINENGIITATGVGETTITGYNEELNLYLETIVKVHNNVEGVVAVPKIVGGENYFVTLKEDGTVWAWGDNSKGQLGLGDNINRNVPTKVEDLEDVIDIATGNYHTLVLKKDGTVWAAGYNINGQLGEGTTTDSNVFKKVNGLNNIVKIAANGYYSGPVGSSYALASNGRVYAWGSNNAGQLGQGVTNNNPNPTPLLVKNASNIIDIDAGARNLIMLSVNGTVYGVGCNTDYELGTGENENKNLPVKMQDENGGELNGVQKISAGLFHTMIIKYDRTVWGVGRNEHNSIGTGTSDINKTRIVEMKASGGNTIANATNIYSGAQATYVLVDNNKMYVAGWNSYNQLFTDNTSESNDVTQVLSDKNILLADLTKHNNAGSSNAAGAVVDTSGYVYTVRIWN